MSSGPPRERHGSRLRLAFYSDATELGGAECVLATLLSLLDERMEVTVLGVNAKIVHWLAARRPGAVPVVLPPVKNKWDLRPILAHLRAVRTIRPDILHANLRIPTACQYGVVAGLLTPGVRVVAVEHAPLPVSNSRQVFLKRAVSTRLDAHVSVGDRAGRMIEELYGLRPQSLRTVHNGVSEPPPIRPFSRNGLRVGWLGRFCEPKGVDRLVRAMSELPQATAVLIGDGPDRDALQTLATDLGVGDRIEMPGWMDDPRPELPTFDVFALPSRLEALPLAVIEAMLAGLPVVASDVGSVSEAVVDGETGFLVPSDDDPRAFAEAIRTLLADENLRRSMGESGRALARERFSAQRMTSAFESLYDELVARG